MEAAQQARRDLYPAGRDSYRFTCALLAAWARASGVVGAPCRHVPAPASIPTLKSLAATASIGAMRALPPYVSLSESEQSREPVRQRGGRLTATPRAHPTAVGLAAAAAAAELLSAAAGCCCWLLLAPAGSCWLLLSACAPLPSRRSATAWPRSAAPRAAPGKPRRRPSTSASAGCAPPTRALAPSRSLLAARLLAAASRAAGRRRRTSARSAAAARAASCGRALRARRARSTLDEAVVCARFYARGALAALG
eukprot:4571783-Prymnesium_polylepis.1